MLKKNEFDENTRGRGSDGNRVLKQEVPMGYQISRPDLSHKNKTREPQFDIGKREKKSRGTQASPRRIISGPRSSGKGTKSYVVKFLPSKPI